MKAPFILSALVATGLTIVSCSKSDSGGGDSGGITHIASQCPHEFFEADSTSKIKHEGDTFKIDGDIIIDGREHTIPGGDGVKYRAGCSNDGVTFRFTKDGQTKTIRMYRDGSGKMQSKED